MLSARTVCCTFLLTIFLILVSQSTNAVLDHSSSLPIGVRNGHALAYDSKRARLVLFGGADESKVCGDTWEWNGKKWTLVSPVGPDARTFPALAYDSVRHRVVLFGGNRVLFGRRPAESRFLDDTWEWDGHRWTQIKAPGPRPRAEAAIAFDIKRGRVVLFGGYDRIDEKLNRLGDTWEWDGISWTQINVAGPSPRNGAALVYDSVRERIVLFGGGTSTGVSGETWEWDGKEWKENREALTPGRFNPAMAFDAARRKVIRFGGRYGGKPFGDTWEYDGKKWTQLTSIGPTARNHSAMAYDSKRKTIVLFGGHDLGHDDANVLVYGDTWEWDGSAWLQKEAGEVKKRTDNGH